MPKEEPQDEQPEEESMHSGTKKTGFVLAKLGPFRCDNCQKFQDSACYEPEVAEDEDLPDRKNRLHKNGAVRVDAGECCDEFLGLNDGQKWKGKLPKKPDHENAIGMKIIRLMGAH